MKSLQIILLLVISSIANIYAQENIIELNGIWRNSSDYSVFYLLESGRYISFNINKDNTIFQDNLETGKYGYYSNKIDVDNKIDIPLSKIELDGYNLALVDDKGGVLGYEFETGDRSLNLYNQNAFFYRKQYVLPQKTINQLRLIGMKKHIDVEKFLYSIETIGINKTVIYTLPDVKSNMYLLKGDKVKILEEKNDWLKIEYRGKKIISGWLKKKDLI